MRISDPQTIRALAHPLRLDLLELLSRTSPATAAQCGRVLGVSQASCSFHLRQLAKYGFVVEAGPGKDRRERLWRVTGRRLRLPAGQGLDPAVVRQLSRVLVERELARLLDYADHASDEPAEWQAASSTIAATISLTTEDLAALKERWHEVLAPHVDAFEATDGRLQPGQRHVRVFTAAWPLPDLDPDDGEGDSDA